MQIRKPLVQTNGQMEQLPSGDAVEIGKLNLEPRETVHVASTIAISRSFVRLRNDTGSTVNVDQIDGGERGDVIIITRRGTGNNILIRKGTGNVEGGPDRLMVTPSDTLMLIKRNDSIWNEVSWQG